jgi:hypothetical protein
MSQHISHDEGTHGSLIHEKHECGHAACLEAPTLNQVPITQCRYVAVIGGVVTLKMGPRLAMGLYLPDEAAGWHMAASGQDYAVWELRTSL